MGVFFVPSDSHKTLLYGCPNFTFFATIQKVLKKIVKPKKKMLIHCPNNWHKTFIFCQNWKYLEIICGTAVEKKLTARKSKIFAGYRVAEFCRNCLWFTQLCEHKFTWRCSWNLMGKICVMAAFALEFQTVQDGRGL